MKESVSVVRECKNVAEEEVRSGWIQAIVVCKHQS